MTTGNISNNIALDRESPEFALGYEDLGIIVSTDFFATVKQYELDISVICKLEVNKKKYFQYISMKNQGVIKYCCGIIE